MIVSTEIVFGQGDQKIIQECLRIRKEVFHIEQARGFPLLEYDKSNSVEDIAYHFLLRVTETDPLTGSTTTKSVGTIRGTTPDVYPTIKRYKLTRLAVDKSYRNHRFGLRRATPSMDPSGRTNDQPPRRGRVPLADPSDGVLRQRRFGYESEGPQFDEDGELHQNMVLRLPLS
ncbi:acyl-CoA N-acyltransferase [Mycena leptocephala]|nr:acyl-CoA N-acyltransferase [Mycena leptocephala]